ncbi:hypothetical protein [Streptomyces lomondensis]|nr:hypothetical protein [Streptomyces lomondensis]MCF0076470.1 hypothetical protein [Streptomyces lomondensis]
MTADALDYSLPGPHTRPAAGRQVFLAGLPDDPPGICAAVTALVIQPA